MGIETAIAWTDHTFNPWWGCTKVSAGCEHCYAETFAKRTGHDVWGKDAPRRFFGRKHWAEPLKWDAAAKAAGVRRRVFCASMADVFEDRDDLDVERTRLFDLIALTPNLDWQLLTKRPENIERLWPIDENPDGSEKGWTLQKGSPNVWVGTTVEDQERADERIPKLLAAPAAVRFLSVEPLLGPVDISVYIGGFRRIEAAEDCDEFALCIRCGDEVPPASEADRASHRCLPGVGPRPDWVIVGGESGPGARPCDVAWIRGVVRQCREAHVPVFVKQMGAYVTDRNDAGFEAECETWADGPDAGRPTHPRAWPTPLDVEDDEYQDHQGARVRVRLKDPKGSDPSEWPEDLRIRKFPVDPAS